MVYGAHVYVVNMVSYGMVCDLSVKLYFAMVHCHL